MGESIQEVGQTPRFPDLNARVLDLDNHKGFDDPLFVNPAPDLELVLVRSGPKVEVAVTAKELRPGVEVASIYVTNLPFPGQSRPPFGSIDGDRIPLPYPEPGRVVLQSRRNQYAFRRGPGSSDPRQSWRP